MRGFKLPFRAVGAVVDKGLLSPIARATQRPLQKAADKKITGKTFNLESGPGIFNPDRIKGFDHAFTVEKFKPLPSMSLHGGYQPIGKGYHLDLSHVISPQWTDATLRTRALREHDERLFQTPQYPRSSPIQPPAQPPVQPPAQSFAQPFTPRPSHFPLRKGGIGSINADMGRPAPELNRKMMPPRPSGALASEHSKRSEDYFIDP